MSTDRHISYSGLTLGLPAGWEGSIYRRAARAGEVTFPVVHAATVPLPAVRGDYGGGLVETLGPDDVFVAVLEFGPEAAGKALFNRINGIPGLTPDSYRTQAMQRTIVGQAGVQRFFTLSGRAFCLYSVIGAYAHRGTLAARANQLIGTLHVAPS